MASTVEEGVIELQPRRSGRQSKERPRKSQSSQPKARYEKKQEQNQPPEQADVSDDDRDLDEEPPKDGEICFVCADHIKYRSIYPCDHTTCHKCALRLRGLMNNRMCTLCRTEKDMVIISERPASERPTFQSFEPEELVYRDTKRGIWFDDRVVKDKVLGLLALRCPASKCGEVLQSWSDLKKHVREKHDKMLCEICTRHKKAFTVEFELYTRSQLQKHEQSGDKKGFNGHPRCEFCRKRYYSNDELFEHCREKHERCFICERLEPTRTEPRYFENYEKLEQHFRDQHFICNVQSCLDKKFVVFGTKVEYQHHMLSEHPQLVGRKKEARIIDVDFTPTSNGDRGSSFGSQLSTVPIQTRSRNNVRPSQNNSVRPSLTYDDSSFPVLGAEPSTGAGGVRSFADPREASVERFHAQQPAADNSPGVLRRRLEERARIYLNYDTKRMDRFVDVNTQFADGVLGASGLVAEYNRLFPDLKPSELEILVHELAAVVKNKSKTLIAAFNSWRERHQYPELGSSRSMPSSSTDLASSWVPNKPRPTGGRLNASDFPSLPTGRTAATITPARSYAATSKAGPLPTTAAPITKRLATVTLSVGPKRSGSQTPEPKLSEDSFPTLPSAPSRRPPPLKPVNTDPSAWGPPSASASSKPSPSVESHSQSDSAGEQGRKQKGRKKQVLYSFGTFQ